MNDRELLQQALDALEMSYELQDIGWVDFEAYKLTCDADILSKLNITIDAIKARLAQPEETVNGWPLFSGIPQPEPVMWQNAALRLGEDLSTVGPDGYYNMTAKQWLDWALSVTTKIQIDYMQLGACEEKSRKDYIGLILGVRVDDASVIIKTKNKDNAKYLCNELLNEKEIYYYPAPPKKEWVGLTDEEILEEYRQSYGDDGNLTDVYFAHAIETKLKEKNT